MKFHIKSCGIVFDKIEFVLLNVRKFEFNFV